MPETMLDLIPQYFRTVNVPFYKRARDGKVMRYTGKYYWYEGEWYYYGNV